MVEVRVRNYLSLNTANELQQTMSAAFSQIDRDGDGRITRDELAAAARSRSSEVSQKVAFAWADNIMMKFDSDHNGSLSADEFNRFLNKRVYQLLATFDELDVEKTGRISAKDVREGLRRAGVPHMDADVARALRRMGKAQDGSVNNAGVNFAAFFDMSVLMPAMTAEQRLLLSTPAGAFPVVAAPPGTTTTSAMVVTAGCVNGAVSRTLTAPTDRLRAVLATGLYPDLRSAFRGILRDQGALGFWASNFANVVQVAPENGMSFFLNEKLRDLLAAEPEQPTVGEKFGIGSAAGAIAMTAVYPMYVVQNRMAAAPAGRYAGMGDAVREVARGGTADAYAGYTTALVRVLPLKGIMLGGYSVLKDLAKDPRTGEISTGRSLACSAVAGGAAHAATYPLHLARTVLQQPVAEDGRRYSGFFDVLRHRLQTHGVGGWYKGLPIWLCNRVPAVAIEFAVNERALDALRKSSAFFSERRGSS